MLGPQQIVPVRQTPGDLDADLLLAGRGPRDLPAGEAGPVLVDFEPDVAGPVKGLGRSAREGLGHVELQGARVADVAVDAEPDRVARLDGFRARALRPGARRVAAQLRVVDVLHGAVRVLVGRLAHKGPVGLGLAVVDEAWEGVLIRKGGSTMLAGVILARPVWELLVGYLHTVGIGRGGKEAEGYDCLHVAPRGMQSGRTLNVIW